MYTESNIDEILNNIMDLECSDEERCNIIKGIMESEVMKSDLDMLNQLNSLDLLDVDDEIDSYTNSLEPGDILAVQRKLPYKHFAVYIDDNKVIHFAADGGDFGKPYIHEAPFEEFLGDSSSYEVLDFGEKREKSFGEYIRNGSSYILGNPLRFIESIRRDRQYHLYSNEETVERAKMVARLHERGDGSLIIPEYNLLMNNCEHFAIWCKTGVHESRQVDRFIMLPS